MAVKCDRNDPSSIETTMHHSTQLQFGHSQCKMTPKETIMTRKYHMHTNPWHHAAVLYTVVTSETTTYTSKSKMTREAAL